MRSMLAVSCKALLGSGGASAGLSCHLLTPRSIEYYSSITRPFLLLFCAQIKCVNRPFLHANE